MSRPNLAQLLAESARNIEQERADKQQVERIAAAVKAKLTHVHASDDDLVCPSCGYKGPESEFESHTDEESDGFSTDDVTSATGDSDPDNRQDGARVPNYDNKVKALKAKYANRHLTVVDRIMINRGFDPFEED